MHIMNKGCVVLTIEEYNDLARKASLCLTPIEAEAAAYVLTIARPKLRDMKVEYVQPFRSAMGKLEARDVRKS